MDWNLTKTKISTDQKLNQYTTHGGEKQCSIITNNQNSRLWPRVCLCVHMCLCAFNDRVWKPRTELCKQIIRKQDCVRVCVFMYVRVCVPLTIEYWTQGIITHRNSTGQIRIRECSSLEQNWSIGVKDRDRIVQTNNQNPRVCVFVPLSIDYWTQGLITHRNRKQFSSESESVQA